MSPPLHHGCVALSDHRDGLLNLNETELRLGLPGSQPPDRQDNASNKVALTLDLLPTTTKSSFSGAKRGFADAIDGAGKWSFGAGGNGSELEMGKGGAFMSPRGEVATGGGAKDDVLKAAAGAGQEKKAVAGNDRGMAKAQVVGWPPIRSFRKNTMATNPSKNKEDGDGKQGLSCLYIKVSMDGAPYLRKVDLKTYGNYKELSKELEKMFSGFTSGQCGSNAIPSKDGLTESRLMDFLSGSEYVLTYEDKDGDWMLVGDVPWEMFSDSCRKLRIMKGSDAIGLAPRAVEKCKNCN